jgi:hypothetical protein
MARNRLETAWRWTPTKRTIRLDPSGKRQIGWRCADCAWGTMSLQVMHEQVNWREPNGAISLVCPQCGAEGHFVDGWFPRSRRGLTGPAPHPVFALLLMGVDTGVPTVPEDARLEAISASEQPTGPMAH